MLLRHSSHQALEEGPLRAHASLQLPRPDSTPLGLLEHEVAEQGVAGEVAAKDGVQGDLGAGGEPCLRQELERDLGWVALRALERLDPVVQGGGDRFSQAQGIGGVPDLGGIGDRPGAGRDRLLDLPLALANGIRELRAGPFSASLPA